MLEGQALSQVVTERVAGGDFVAGWFCFAADCDCVSSCDCVEDCDCVDDLFVMFVRIILQ